VLYKIKCCSKSEDKRTIVVSSTNRQSKKEMIFGAVEGKIWSCCTAKRDEGCFTIVLFCGSLFSSSSIINFDSFDCSKNKS